MSYKGTPASSQIIWLEQRVEQLESGPGGIMEMKQTIADKERRIEKLETALRYYAKEYENPFGGNDSLIAREVLEDKDD